VLLIDFFWFGSAFCFSIYFLTYYLYQKSELKS